MSDAVEGSGQGVRIRSAWMMTSSTSLVLGMVALVASPIVSRSLGTDGRGRLVAIQLVPQLLADLAALGMGFAIVHYGARHRRSIGTFIRWASRAAVIGSIVMFAAGQVLAGAVVGGEGDDLMLFRIYLLICPLTAFIVVLNESQRAIGEFRSWNAFVLARGLAWPVATLTAIVISDDPFAAIVAIHLALMAAVLATLCATTWPRLRRARSESDVGAGEFNRYGLAAAVSTVPRTANAKLDQVVMTFVAGRDNLGLYAAAVGWSGLTIPVMRGLTGISMPHVSSASLDQRLARVRQLVTFGILAMAIVSVAGVAATFVLWVPLYGSEFASARLAAMVLIPAALLLEFNAVLANVLRSLDRPSLVAVLEIVVLVVSAGLLVAVLRTSQVLGPALLSFGTYFTACVMYAWFIARDLGVGLTALFDVQAARGIASRLLRRAGAS